MQSRDFQLDVALDQGLTKLKIIMPLSLKCFALSRMSEQQIECNTMKQLQLLKKTTLHFVITN